MPKPDIDFLTIGFDAVAVGIQFAPSLVSESVLQDIRDGAFFPVVVAIGISFWDVDLYVVTRLVGGRSMLVYYTNLGSNTEARTSKWIGTNLRHHIHKVSSKW